MDWAIIFQAEDGIRYIGVTGVQTCALPLCARQPRSASAGRMGSHMALELGAWCSSTSGGLSTSPRSEERRVGKECRSRWSPHHYKKKRTQNISHTASSLDWLLMVNLTDSCL